MGLACPPSSALDCLAGSIVAIVALPPSMLIADLSGVERKLPKIRS